MHSSATCTINAGVRLPNYLLRFFSSVWLCQQSYCRGAGVRRPSAVVRPSVVRKLRFLRNRCMDPGHFLWVAPSPTYIQTIFISACVYTAELLSWRRRPSDVRPSSVRKFSGFSETTACIQTKFCGKLHIRLFFVFSKNKKIASASCGPEEATNKIWKKFVH